MPDLETSVREHCDLFNSCVTTGEWEPFLATFVDDARMVLTAMPDRPIIGRQALEALYAANPPRDTMTMDRVVPLDDTTARAEFTWGRGAPGSMTVTWAGDRVAAVELS